MLKKIAFKIVLRELSKCNLFVGVYDAKNGNPHFMYGVSTVMESIAYHISEKEGDKFNEIFSKNFEKSVDKVEKA